MTTLTVINHPHRSLLVICCLQHLASPTRRVYTHHLNQFLASGNPLNREGVGQFVYAATTVSVTNQRLSAIKQLVAEAESRGLIDTAIASAIRAMKGKHSYGQRAGNWMDLAQCKAMLDRTKASTTALRDSALLSLLLGCGLRRSEAAALTLDHWQMRDGRRVILDLKGKKNRVRTIPVPTWVEHNVSLWIASSGRDQTSIYLLNSFDRNGNAKGSMTESGVWWVVSEYARAIGLPLIRPHDLRRTYAKISRMSGAPLDQLQCSLGHSDVRTTQIYVGDIQDLGKGPGDYWEP